MAATTAVMDWIAMNKFCHFQPRCEPCFSSRAMIVWIRDIIMRHQIDQKQWISNDVILPHAGQLHIARYRWAYNNLSVTYTVSQSQRALRTPTAAASYASVISTSASPPTAASFRC